MTLFPIISLSSYWEIKNTQSNDKWSPCYSFWLIRVVHHQFCFFHMENGARHFTSPRHSVSRHQPFLFLRTVTHRHLFFLHFPHHVSLGLTFSLVFFFWFPCKCNLWEGTVIHLQHISSPYLFADSFHGSSLLHLFCWSIRVSNETFMLVSHLF